ncbi:MAG TPA: phosphoribosylanthranilate isomerase [Acidimicrobiia bacterium]|nr:phosphoribosylanthranilate isomerase [Acidimicrobiia bacterium]
MFIKICGITSEQDALLATALDTDALGFVFAASPRQVAPDLVRDIAKRLPREVHTVGVFRNERPEQILRIVNRTGLHGVQLHGRETDGEVAWLKERVRFVIRAYGAGDPALAHAAKSGADIVLVDSPDPGSGKVFDWRLAEGAPGGVRLMLAGGLNPENVGEAIRLVRPWGVDVSTGVEESPGRKDPRKLRQFIEAARDAAAIASGHTIDLTDSDEVAGVTRPWDWQIDE